MIKRAFDDLYFKKLAKSCKLGEELSNLTKEFIKNSKKRNL